MRKTGYLAVCLVFLAGVITYYYYFHFKDKSEFRVADALYEQNVDLDLDGQEEIISFYSPKTDLNDVSSIYTNLFINKKTEPKIVLSGYFQRSNVYDIAHGVRLLEVQTNSGGKLNNFTVYRYQNGDLMVIPIFSSSKKFTQGIFSSGGTEYKDIDADDILEMLAYYRHYPPEAKRSVEIYKFDDSKFIKINDYEEITQNIYY